MTARTHDVIALSSLVTASVYFPPSELNVTTAFVCLVGSVVGSLAPDLDQASNRLWDMLPAGNYVGKILRKLFIQHRTISHSLLGTWLMYKILSFVLPKIFNPDFVQVQLVITSIMIGFISHLIADMFTKKGIPLFFPIPIKIGIPPIKKLRIKAGKFAEKFVIFPGTILYLFWFIAKNREQLLQVVKNIS